MPSSEEEAQALGHSEFWDARYKNAEGDKPTHEWFRAFGELEPFFEKHLFQGRGEEGKKSRILHLGSGDSVGSFLFQPPNPILLHDGLRVECHYDILPNNIILFF